MFETEFCSSFTEVDLVVEQAQKYLADCASATLTPVAFFVLFALRELLNNAVEHGNQLEPHRKVCVALLLDESGLEICVRDEGGGGNAPIWLERILQQKEAAPGISPGMPAGIPDGIPERSRGLPALLEMGFEIVRRDGAMVARLKPGMMLQLAKR